MSTKETCAKAETVKFNDMGITNAYANVSKVSSFREEVVLMFGRNKT